MMRCRRWNEAGLLILLSSATATATLVELFGLRMINKGRGALPGKVRFCGSPLATCIYVGSSVLSLITKPSVSTVESKSTVTSKSLRSHLSLRGGKPHPGKVRHFHVQGVADPASTIVTSAVEEGLAVEAGPWPWKRLVELTLLSDLEMSFFRRGSKALVVEKGARRAVDKTRPCTFPDRGITFLSVLEMSFGLPPHLLRSRRKTAQTCRPHNTSSRRREKKVFALQPFLPTPANPATTTTTTTTTTTRTNKCGSRGSRLAEKRSLSDIDQYRVEGYICIERVSYLCTLEKGLTFSSQIAKLEEGNEKKGIGYGNKSESVLS
ncbi:hypothetical protein THAOC_20088 [Thalassiosira oceanica]|uniref:Uncharacterized protein n=1 Tax=Thalassiosira oceanica TaxID=159749 RepID=K0S370_THAOC|nr:hypothetical protein THAOC_20088 [Thalassiosira oceanica]|eukprot:EJK59655.1 hypothetical protein THAOC_20088 [Thalassiosira oceanica]